MQAHWKENGPPVYMSVAGYLGLIDGKRKPQETGDLEELEKQFGSGAMF